MATSSAINNEPVASGAKVDMKFEVIVIPVADVDRSKAFCGIQRSGADGVFVAHAIGLYDKFLKGGRAVVPSDGLLSLSNPLACFFCCPLTERKDPVEGIYHQMKHYFGSSMEQLANSNVPRPGWRERTPDH